MEDIFVYGSLFILLFSSILLIAVAIKKAVSIVTVYEYERGLKYYKGNFIKVLDPGQYWIFPLNTNIEKVDLRPTFITVPGQEVLTSEGVTLKVSMVANYEIKDPVAVFNKNENYLEALYLILQLSLREIIGSIKIEEILEKRNYLSEKLKDSTEEKVSKLGLKLHSVSIKDITFSGELKKAFAQVVQAQKEALAKLEKARSETASLRNLANAAKMLENNPWLMQLRVLQSLGETSGNTIVLNISSENSPFLLKNNDKDKTKQFD